MIGLPHFNACIKSSMSSYFKASASNLKTFEPFTSCDGVVPSSVVPHAFTIFF
jgi:nucleotidyltransferase/DNA polymerase involved in DNA repair